MSTTIKSKGKPYTITELAAMYGVSTKTLRNWMEPHLSVIGQRKGRYYTTLQIRRIYDCLGAPEGAEE